YVGTILSFGRWDEAVAARAAEFTEAPVLRVRGDRGVAALLNDLGAPARFGAAAVQPARKVMAI
ncbi:MAG TPA: hypothetical protein VIO94_08950, partial [Phenylobacterium sp.]